jgi:hypothetical protein
MLDFLSQEVKQVAEGLMQNGITVNEAQNALHAVRELRGLGIPPADWPRLSDTAAKLADPEFREGALRLLKLERDAGMDYKSLLSHFERVCAEVNKREELKLRLDSDIGARRNEANGLKKEVASLKRETEESRRVTEEELRKNNVIRGEVEDTLRLKATLLDKNLDIATALGIAQEVGGSQEEVRRLLGELKSLLEANKRAKAEHERLSSSRAKLLSEKAALEAEVEGLLARKNEIEGSIDKELNTLDALRRRRQIKEKEYGLFEALLAMFSGGTPYQDATPEKLASAILELGKGWYPGRPPEELKGMFVTAVCGSYLHSIRCTQCQARFIVDRSCDACDRYHDKYQCPVCRSSWYTEANEDFIRAMFSQEELTLSAKLCQEIEKLKPMEVFLDIPCSRCKKPMGNNWTREQALSAFSGWGHRACVR